MYVWHKDPEQSKTIFDLLLMSGADPNKINKEGISAFQSAVKRGNVNIVKDLVELIKRPNGLTKININ